MAACATLLYSFPCLLTAQLTQTLSRKRPRLCAGLPRFLADLSFGVLSFSEKAK